MQLRPFTSSATHASMTLDSTLESLKDGYRLSFDLQGEGLADLDWPTPSSQPAFKEELWKKTCFECFFGVANSTRYFEFNGSPSGDWALYAFEDYRSGMTPLKVDHPPRLETVHVENARIKVVWFIPYFSQVLFQSVGITAIIKRKPTTEKTAPEIDYWALIHAGEKPDFHLRKSFAIRLF